MVLKLYICKKCINTAQLQNLILLEKAQPTIEIIHSEPDWQPEQSRSSDLEAYRQIPEHQRKMGRNVSEEPIQPQQEIQSKGLKFSEGTGIRY